MPRENIQHAEPPATASNVYQLVEWGAAVLDQADLYYGHGTDNPGDEALQLVLHAAGLDYGSTEAELRRPLAAPLRDAAVRLIRRRASERKPAPYLTGVAWYGGLKFRVDERVLVPRSSILELVEARFQPWLQHSPARILDLCTGSGCLAIHAAIVFPDAAVDAADISPGALEVARGNLADHGLSQRIGLVESDVFAGLAGRRYDLIISNPPYVGSGEMATLPAEYRHEPVLGLQADDNGLAVVARILSNAASHLEPQGLLVVEVGNSEHAVMERWPDLPLVWPEFERSEGGVFIIGAGDLRDWLKSRHIRE
jgi:ribosomal protein L3 glutamine methyltransferase